MITSMNNYDEDDKLMFDEDQDFEDLDDFDQDEDDELLTQHSLASSNDFNIDQTNYLDNSFQNQNQSSQAEQKQDQPKKPRTKKVKKTEYECAKIKGSGQNRRLHIIQDVLNSLAPQKVDMTVKFLNSLPPQLFWKLLTSLIEKALIDGLHGTDYREIQWATTFANHEAKVDAKLDAFKKDIYKLLLNNNNFYESKEFQKALEEQPDQ